MRSNKIQVWVLSCTIVVITLAGLVPVCNGAEGVRLGEKGPMYQLKSSRVLNLTDEVTLEAWVKAEKMPHGGGRILDKSVPGTQVGYMLDTFPGNSLRFLNAKGICAFSANLGAEKWAHVAGVYWPKGYIPFGPQRAKRIPVSTDWSWLRYFPHR